MALVQHGFSFDSNNHRIVHSQSMQVSWIVCRCRLSNVGANLTLLCVQCHFPTKTTFWVGSWPLLIQAAS